MLVLVDPDNEDHLKFLYRLLLERYEIGVVNLPGITPGMPVDVNVPPPEPPTFSEHVRYIQSKPYRYFYLYFKHDSPVASVLMMHHDREIGVFVLKSHWGEGIAGMALRALLEAHPTKSVTAKVHADNARSNALFDKLGFRHVVNVWALPDSRELKSC